MSSDRFSAARAVADAVLYEGYVLYPYRASARKNQLRWQFGVLVPPAYARADGSERSVMRTEVIVDPGAEAVLTVRVRCLQVQRREVEEVDAGGAFVPAVALDVDGTNLVSWDEALEHELDLERIPLLPADGAKREVSMRLGAGEQTDVVRTASGRLAGRVTRHREGVTGVVRVDAEWVEGTLLKVSIAVENTTDWNEPSAGRDAAMHRSFVAVHTLLALDDGAFVSLLDPPEQAAAAVATCTNEGTFPVLIGDEAATDLVLSAPIILYDHPAVAPESDGDFCDATEIDEILALRTLTLTDEEKAEARGTDPRAAAIIDRCDDMPPEVWARLHGAVRSLRPVPQPTEPVPWWDPGVDAGFDPWTDTTLVDGVEIGKGTRVRLRPSRRADAHDLFLADREATVAGIFRDVDGGEHVAVTLDDDPASELLDWQRRYLYFHPDEIEVLAVAEERP